MQNVYNGYPNRSPNLNFVQITIIVILYMYVSYIGTL